MNAAWNIPRRDRPSFGWQLARSIGALLLVAAEVVAATVLAERAIAGTGVVGRIGVFVGSFLLNLLLLMALFRVLTGTTVRWAQLAPGAAGAAIGWRAVQTIGVVVLTRQLDRADLVFGVFAVVIVLLFWLYLSCQVVLYAVEINVVLTRRLWPRSLQAPLTEAGRRVLAALAKTQQRHPEQQVPVTFPDAQNSGDGT